MNCEIKVGVDYDYFDDGKIKPSRKYNVTITKILKKNEIDEDTLKLWEEESTKCDWLYAKETDYFIKGELWIDLTRNEEITFVRTLDGGWFSLGFWGGRLKEKEFWPKYIEENELYDWYADSTTYEKLTVEQ